jgi:KaiC/GvpD/RAD55 family RecA-like ATPase
MITQGAPPGQEDQVQGVEPESPLNEQSGNAGLLDLIMSFLESTGNVLLIQGPPGTGKTTLALELLRRMEGPRIGSRTIPPNRLYVSSRVSPPRLRKHFPWLNEVVDSISGRTAKGSVSEAVSDFRVSQADSILSKVLNMKHSRQRSLIVIDSWEGALRNTTEEGRRMLESAILSEPEESRVSVVLVNEGGQTSDMAHLVDGVVSLSLSELEGRRVRRLFVNKLRGLRVQTNQGLFSLDRGRFTFLSDVELVDSTSPKGKTPEPIAHSETSFSTGSPDLDKMLKGGVRKGSSLLLDLNSTVSPLEMRLLLRIIIANFVNQGGASIIVPSSTISSENVAEALGRCVGQKALEQRVRIAEFNQVLPARKWRLSLKGRLEEDGLSFGNCWKEMSSVSSSIVLASDFDKIVQVYGEDLFLPGLADIGASIRDSRALSIGMASRPTKLREDFLRIADYHLKMQNINGSLVIYGVKPFTNIHGVSFEFEKGFPELRLREVV